MWNSLPLKERNRLALMYFSELYDCNHCPLGGNLDDCYVMCEAAAYGLRPDKKWNILDWSKLESMLKKN